MKIQYLGTGAAEGIPGLFCQCDVCRDAIKNKGKNIRGRCGVLIDDALMVDFPPDIFMQALRFDIDLFKVTDIIVSHAHHDHFDASELVMRKTYQFCTVTDGNYCIHIHGNERVKEKLNEAAEEEFEGKVAVDFIEYHLMQAFCPVQVGDFTVTPFPAMHHYSEKALNYLFQKDGKAYLYGHDSGGFYDEVFDYLKEHRIYLNAASLDCTLGGREGGGTHTGIPADREIKRRLLAQNSADEHTVFILSHMGHNSGINHKQTEQLAKPYGFTVAYDGMTVNL